MTIRELISMDEIQIGDICRTNLSQPGGLVEIIRIEKNHNGRLCAQIIHIEDHPYGYPKGTIGWYFVDELIKQRTDRSE